MFGHDEEKKLYVENGQYVSAPFQPKNIFQKAASAVTALATGTRVSDEIAAKRLDICRTCPKIKDAGTANEACSICGCSLGGSKSKHLLSLTTFEEGPSWGCYYYAATRDKNLPYPQRSKWAENGL